MYHGLWKFSCIQQMLLIRMFYKCISPPVLKAMEMWIKTLHYSVTRVKNDGK